MQKTELITGIIELQRRINRYMRRHTLGAWMELNITIPQLRSLFFIANHGTTNFTKLAAALGVTPSNVTGIVDRLLEQGLVSRQENQEDRRQLILRVTDKGESIVTGLRDRRARHISEILSHLTQEELNTIYKGLGILARAAETHEEKP
jgi:DNA-binding MarR family transcriptional regulator